MSTLQLKPRELKIISVIAATHSIGDAAALLGMAQANVSKYLSDFETRVGLKVFERTTRRLKVTPAGESLLRETARIPSILEAAVRQAQAPENRTGTSRHKLYV